MEPAAATEGGHSSLVVVVTALAVVAVLVVVLAGGVYCRRSRNRQEQQPPTAGAEVEVEIFTHSGSPAGGFAGRVTNPTFQLELAPPIAPTRSLRSHGAGNGGHPRGAEGPLPSELSDPEYLDPSAEQPAVLRRLA